MKNWFLWNEVLEKTLESPLDSTRSNQSILEEINPEYSLEVLMLKMKLQHFGHLMQRVRSLEKDPDAGKDRRQKEKRAAEDKMVRLHHWLNRHESEQTLGDGEGQGSQVCCSPWNCRVRYNLATEQLLGQDLFFKPLGFLLSLCVLCWIPLLWPLAPSLTMTQVHPLGSSVSSLLGCSICCWCSFHTLLAHTPLVHSAAAVRSSQHGDSLVQKWPQGQGS